MCGYASAQSSVVYIITKRLAINLIFIESTVWLLLHITYFLSVCVWICVYVYVCVFVWT